MLRLLLSLICGLAIAATLLLMRQQRLELQHQCNALHDEMLVTQKQLWEQQLQIAAAVSPAALKAVLVSHEQRTSTEVGGTGEGGEAENSQGWEVLRRPARPGS
jgi:hypothetical protein